VNADGLFQTPGLKPVLAALPHARLVGGCVRDMLAGREVADIDLATPDPPETVLEALARAGLRAIPTGLAHGTVTAISEGRPFEITTLRRDEESFGRHARVAWTADFREDAARRDFTINAMSLSQDGVLHDYFGGAEDLRRGHVRFVGVAAERVREDYLRILRFFRFTARYGTPPPDAAAIAAIRAGLDGLRGLSAERVASELKRILAAPDPLDALRLMRETGVLERLLPGAHDLEELARLLRGAAPPDPVLRLAALFRGDVDDLAAHLKLSNAERDRMRSLRAGPVPEGGADEASLRCLLAEEPAEMLIDRAHLAGGWTPRLQERLHSMERPVFPLEGRDALALGASPGPHVGQALKELRSRWLASGCTLSRDALMQALGGLLGGMRD
jgi:tRNA nucleotidyltransferase/poly(A) polymerase